MKLLLILCVFLYAARTTAQPFELLGRYGASFIGGETIDFIKEDSFYFNGFYCTYGVSGKGTCEIKDGYLYLYFSRETPVLKPVQRPPVVDFAPDSGTTVEIKLVNQVDGQPVSYATAAGYIKNQMRFGAAANDSGRAFLKIPPERVPFMLSCTSVGYQVVSVPVDTAGRYRITIYMMPGSNGDRVLNNGEIWTYQLGEITDTYFEARPAWGKGRFRIYRKRDK